MLQIIPKNFVRAAAKAAAVKPMVTRELGNGYIVCGQYTVRFTAIHGGLWASCDCRAGVGYGRRAPLPCYHVAAVLQSPRGNVSFESQAQATEQREQTIAEFDQLTGTDY